MNKTTRLIAAGLLLAALMLVVGCAKDKNNVTTAEPTDMFTGMPSGQGIFGSAEPLSSAEPATGDPGTTAEPEPSASPDGSGANESGTIEGFMSGNVVDPADVPDVVDRLNSEFPDHTVQSMSYETYMGMQTYRVTLQGDGELARVVYVLADGTIVIPKAMD